jgi:hypothetical protein
VAIARDVGTQGSEVGQEVGKLLDWHVYDRELLEHIANEMGLRTALLESVDEKDRSFFLESVEAFLSPVKGAWGPLVSESAFVHRLVETVLGLGLRGECVIVGRGAVFILPAATTLRVRLVGPAAERATALGDKLGLSAAEAARRVRTVDRERRDFVRDHFLKDPTDPSNYDLVLNATRFSVRETAELIFESLRRLQLHGVPAGATRQVTHAPVGRSG